MVGWAGAANPHPHHHTQPPFQHRDIHKKLLERWLSQFSTLAHGPTDGQTDRWTDKWMDKASYRAAILQLKSRIPIELRGKLSQNETRLYGVQYIDFFFAADIDYDKIFKNI